MICLFQVRGKHDNARPLTLVEPYPQSIEQGAKDGLLWEQVYASLHAIMHRSKGFPS